MGNKEKYNNFKKDKREEVKAETFVKETNLDMAEESAVEEVKIVEEIPVVAPVLKSEQKQKKPAATSTFVKRLY